MTNDLQDKPERAYRGVVWVWLCWLGAILVLYVLSSGPVLKLVDKKLIRRNTPPYETFTRVYSPLAWARDHTFLRRPLGMYWHLWAAERFDSKGNPNLRPD